MSSKIINHQLLLKGLHKGLSGFWWMLKIIVPISLITTLLDYSGLINSIDSLFEPIMGFLHMPTMAAVPLIAGLTTVIFGGIAAIVCVHVFALIYKFAVFVKMTTIRTSGGL